MNPGNLFQEFVNRTDKSLAALEELINTRSSEILNKFTEVNIRFDAMEATQKVVLEQLNFKKKRQYHGPTVRSNLTEEDRVFAQTYLPGPGESSKLETLIDRHEKEGNTEVVNKLETMLGNRSILDRKFTQKVVTAYASWENQRSGDHYHAYLLDVDRVSKLKKYAEEDYIDEPSTKKARKLYPQSIEDITSTGVIYPVNEKIILKPTQNFIPEDRIPEVEKILHKLVHDKTLTNVELTELKHVMGLQIEFKTDGSIRIIVNGKELSKALPKHQVKLPKRSDIFKTVKDYSYACVVDVKDCFYNIPVSEESKQYLGVQLNKKYYRFEKCPMGVTTSCEACSALTNSIAQMTHPSILVQIDDFLVVGLTPEEVIERRDALIHNLEKYKLKINYTKSKLEPTQQIEYLGYHLDFEDHEVFNTEQNIQNATDLLGNLEPGYYKNTDIQTLVGTIGSNAPTRSANKKLNCIRRKLVNVKRTENYPIHITSDDVAVLKNVHAQSDEALQEKIGKKHTK